jgi:hypothetical protein
MGKIISKHVQENEGKKIMVERKKYDTNDHGKTARF